MAKLERETPVDLEIPGHTVILGEHTYKVVPQRIGYLRSRLGVALGDLVDLELSSDNIIGVLGSRVYAVLSVFIPDLMPEWEFKGFPTREAMLADEYQEEYDKSPSPPQIRQAFAAAAEVNEIDLLRHLGKLIGPEVIRAWIAGALADSMTSSSESSSVTSGPDTPSTTSGTSPLTSVPNEG